MTDHPPLTERQREVVAAVTGHIKGAARVVGIPHARTPQRRL